MDVALIVGIIGSVVLIIAWLIETAENIRKHRLAIHPHFAVLYIAGNALLAYYSALIGSSVFFWLSMALMAAIIGELLYSMKMKRRH